MKNCRKNYLLSICYYYKPNREISENHHLTELYHFFGNEIPSGVEITSTIFSDDRTSNVKSLSSLG